jgi:PTH1 family peptidyl-tRNA hydrolase
VLNAIIVGLGNPGSRYALTRHNVGFLFLDHLAKKAGVSFSNSRKWKAEYAEIQFRSLNLFLLKPQTFMNLSGESLRALYQDQCHLKDPLCRLIVAHDEVDLPFGRIRVKMGGGDAGHNGLRSLRGILGHGDFERLRLGVGRPPLGSPIELGDYVLQAFSGEEQSHLPSLFEKSETLIELLATDQLALAQNKAAE